MKKKIRTILFSLLSLTMAIVIASIGSLQIFADNKPGHNQQTTPKVVYGNTYVKDIIIVTEDEACNMEEPYNEYEVLNDPFFEDDNESLYFAVLTTDKADEAITDIKAMNMNGDYDYKAYAEYLNTVNEWAQAKADTTMTAIEEFQDNYDAEKPGALFAHKMLNYFVGDNDRVPLGDFFVKDEYANYLGIQVKNLVMKSNLIILTYIRQLLLIACSDTLETNFVDQLLDYGGDNSLKKLEEDNLYRTAAQDLINSMGETSRKINAYRTALAKHGADLDDYLTERQEAVNKVLSKDEIEYDAYKAANDERNALNDIIAGQVLAELFDDVYYTDNDGNKLSITDILAKDPEAKNEEDRPTIEMVAPIAALMSEGQRALAGCGFDKLVASVINDYSGEDSEYENDLDKIFELWETASDGSCVSIYSGVDLSLYDPNGIAMVGKSGEFLENGEDKDYSFLGIPTYAACIMLGGGLVGVVGSAVGLKRGISVLKQVNRLEDKLLGATSSIREANVVVAKFKAQGASEGWGRLPMVREDINTCLKQATTFENELATMPSYAGAVARVAFSAFMLTLSVILVAFSIVTLIMNALHEDEPGEYKQIPRVLVNAIEKTEYDERQQTTTTTQMIFYKGIIDPFMSDEDAEKNNTPSKVVDMFNWSLTAIDREWIALYTTKDGRVGHPIIYDGAENTLVTLIDDGSSYATLEEDQGFNGRVNIFNKDSYVECGDGIIVYNSDLKVESETRSGLGGSMTINNGQFILFIMLAAMVGVGIGAGACILVKNTRKKKEDAVVIA